MTSLAGTHLWECSQRADSFDSMAWCCWMRANSEGGQAWQSDCHIGCDLDPNVRTQVRAQGKCLMLLTRPHGPTAVHRGHTLAQRVAKQRLSWRSSHDSFLWVVLRKTPAVASVKQESQPPCLSFEHTAVCFSSQLAPVARVEWYQLSSGSGLALVWSRHHGHQAPETEPRTRPYKAWATASVGRLSGWVLWQRLCSSQQQEENFVRYPLEVLVSSLTGTVVLMSASFQTAFRGIWSVNRFLEECATRVTGLLCTAGPTATSWQVRKQNTIRQPCAAPRTNACPSRVTRELSRRWPYAHLSRCDRAYTQLCQHNLLPPQAQWGPSSSLSCWSNHHSHLRLRPAGTDAFPSDQQAQPHLQRGLWALQPAGWGPAAKLA